MAEMLSGMTVAGLPVLLDHKDQVAGLLRNWLDPQWTMREQPLASYSDAESTIPTIPYSPRPILKCNQLYWPTGASRYAELTVLMTQTHLRALIHEAWGLDWDDERGYDPPSGENLLQYVADSVNVKIKYPDWSADIPMYVADFKYITFQYTTDPRERLVAVRLVDDRFWWQTTGYGGSCVGRPATGPPAPSFPTREVGDTWKTWYELFEELFASVHVPVAATGTSKQRWSISQTNLDDYEYPDPVAFNRPFESVGLLLDAAAASVGARITRNFDGYVHVHCAGEDEMTTSDVVDDPYPTGSSQERVIIGGRNMPPPRFNRLLVKFRRITNNHYDDVDPYYWMLINNNIANTTDWANIEVVDESNYTWSALINKSAYGTLGVTDVVFTTFHAHFPDPEASTPTNYDACKKAAQLIARDRMVWNHRTQQFTISASALFVLEVSAFEDYVLYDIGTEIEPKTYLEESGKESDSPVMKTEINRKITTTVGSVNSDMWPRHILCQGQEVILPEYSYFKYSEMVDQVGPGGEFLANYVVYDGDTDVAAEARGDAWDVPAGDALDEFTIYDP